MLHWNKCVAGVGKSCTVGVAVPVASSAAAAAAAAACTVIKALHLAKNTPFIPLISCTLAAAFGQTNLHKYFTAPYTYRRTHREWHKN